MASLDPERRAMNRAAAHEFVKSNHHAVMVTRRSDGGLHTTPVLAGVDDDGLVISSRETTFKSNNLRRDPRVTLCVMNDRFYGDWIQVDGTATIVSLPEAMDGLIDYYRRISGEHPDWDDYRRAMKEEKRVLIRVTIEAAGPTRTG